MTEPKPDYALIASEFRRILDIAESTEPFTVESDSAYKRLGLFCSAYGEDIERGIKVLCFQESGQTQERLV